MLLPSTVKLSTSKDCNPASVNVVSPFDNDVVPIVISLATTAPEVTVKFVESNDATPLLDAVASSAETVNVFDALLYDTSIPSPSTIDKSSDNKSNEPVTVPSDRPRVVATLTWPAAVN